MAADFEFSGLAGVLANMEAWGDRVVDAADEAVDEAGSQGASLVEAAAPVLTGKLRASVEHDHVAWGISVVSVGGGIRTPATGSPHQVLQPKHQWHTGRSTRSGVRHDHQEGVLDAVDARAC